MFFLLPFPFCCAGRNAISTAQIWLLRLCWYSYPSLWPHKIKLRLGYLNLALFRNVTDIIHLTGCMLSVVFKKFILTKVRLVMIPQAPPITMHSTYECQKYAISYLACLASLDLWTWQHPVRQASLAFYLFSPLIAVKGVHPILDSAAFPYTNSLLSEPCLASEHFIVVSTYSKTVVRWHWDCCRAP